MIIKNGKRLDGFCVDSLPIGTLQPYLGLKAPNGYLICDGSLISKTVYPDLYVICGSLFGTETETHFYLPDLRGKTIAGYNADDSTLNTIGKLLGTISHTHTSAAHTHTIAGHVHTTGNHTLTIDEVPAHSHQVYDNNRAMFLATGTTEGTENGKMINGLPNTAYALGDAHVLMARSDGSGGNGAHNHGNTGSTSLTTDSTTPGATGSASNYQPTMVANWIVKAKMIAPVTAYVENSLTSTNTENALSAAQGKILNDKFANYMSLQGGTVNGTIGLYATTQDMGIAFSAYDSSSGAQLSMGIGSSHINHGIYSDSLDKWLIYANQETGDVIIPRNILIGDTGFTNVGMKMVSNTNGRAILFDNGLMMCMGHVQGTTSSSENTALGAANIAYVHCDWTYPQAFKTVYHVMATCDDLDNGFYVAEVDGTPGLSTMRVALGGSASREVGAYVFAIGAWK